MRYENGVPREMSDLYPEPAMNHPTGGDTRNILDLCEHIRALSAFVAQLHKRVTELEELVKANK